jgi:PadR family transcriptional regulator AphA
MEWAIVEDGRGRYLECLSEERPIASDRDAAALVEGCFEHGAERLMLHGGTLSGEFFDLKSGVAGTLLQKLANYRIRAVLVAAADGAERGRRFAELVAETNRGDQFGVFPTRAEAEAWLLH